MNFDPATLIRFLHRSRGGRHTPLVGLARDFGLGYLPDTRKMRMLQTDSRAHYASSQVIEASLGEHRWQTLDQNNVGACTFHGTPMALWVSAAARSKPLPFFPSPRIGYGLVRTLELQTADDPLTDSGAMPSDLIPVVNKWGIAPIGTGASFPSPEGYTSDVDETNVNVKPSLLDLETAGLALQISPLRIDETSVDFAGQISANIQNVTAMGVGIFVDTTNFMQWDPSTGPISQINTRDPDGGGHWLEMDYIYTTGGIVVVGGINSWGERWAQPSGKVASPFWKPGGWEITLECLRGVCSDCLAFPVAA